MNGAELAVDVLVRRGVDVCFGNPGTTEMNLVAAVAHRDEMRYVPVLFEGVAVGAADGFHRIAERPAMALLHNGIGLTNALSSLFNARRAGAGALVVVGDHPESLQPHLSTMSSGVRIADTAAAAVSWTARIGSSERIAPTLDEAFAATRRAPGGPAVIAFPYDLAWSPADAGATVSDVAPDGSLRVSDGVIEDIAEVVRTGGRVALLLGNAATRTDDALEDAGRIAGVSGCRLLSRPAVLLRGPDRVAVEQFTYSPLHGVAALADIDHLVLVGIDPPVMPWTYPHRDRVLLTGDTTHLHTLARVDQDVPDALRRLADILGGIPTEHPALPLPEPASGPATAAAIAQCLAALLPGDAVLLNEGISNGPVLHEATAASRRHTLLTNIGGAIGWAQCAAIGAALAAPHRKVIAVQGDGAAMYMPQALWTLAREQLDVVIVVLANQTYRVLERDLEYRDLQGAHDLLRMDDPRIDWVELAQGLGVPGERVDTADAFTEVFARAIEAPGPRLIVVDLVD